MNAATQGMSNEQLKALVAKLEAEVEASKAASAVSMKIHIGPKGTVCVTGIASKYGVPLYMDAWVKLNDFMPKVMSFIKENEALLAKKGVPYVAPVKA